MDSPSIFDEAVTDILTNNIKFCCVKAPTSSGKTSTFVSKLIKLSHKKIRVLTLLPTREAVYNAYDRVATNEVAHVNVDFSVGWSANKVISYYNYKSLVISSTINGEQIPNIGDNEDTQLVFCTIGHGKRLIDESIRYLGTEDYINPRLMNIFDYVIVDEAHLKNMDLDTTIGRLKYLLVTYPNKQVPNIIYTSATPPDEKGMKIYDIDAPMKFKNPPLYIDTGATTMIGIIESIADGLYDVLSDNKLTPSIVLVFLPGIKEINIVKDALFTVDVTNSLEVVVAHSSRTRKQMKDEVFTPNKPGKWKIILATNIAETSITIPGVTIVVDSCIEYIREIGSNKTTYNKMQFISKDSAKQRAGRVGRTTNGIVIRMLPENKFNELPKSKVPEIERLPISNELLHVLDLNIDVRFIFGNINDGISKSLNEKQSIRLNKTLNELKYLKLIKKCGDYFMVTPAGKFVSSLMVTDKTGVLINNGIEAGLPPYPVIVMACAIENAEMIFKNFYPPKEFISEIPFATLINPWLKMCAKFGTLKVPKEKLEKFCHDFGLDYDGFQDLQSKIINTISKVEKMGYIVDIFMFDPEDIFLNLKNILDNLYYKYIKADNDDFYLNPVNKSTNPRPLYINNRLISTPHGTSEFETIVSVMNVDMKGKTQMILWYPVNYIPTKQFTVEKILKETEQEIIPDEELIDESSDPYWNDIEDIQKYDEYQGEAQISEDDNNVI